MGAVFHTGVLTALCLDVNSRVSYVLSTVLDKLADFPKATPSPSIF